VNEKLKSMKMQVECEAGGLDRMVGRMIKWSKIMGDIPDGIVADRGTLRSESLPGDGAGLYRCTVETRSGTWYQDFFLNLGGQP